MKFIKLFFILSFVFVLFFISNSNASATGYCMINTWANTPGNDLQNAPCAGRPEISTDPDLPGCTSIPYYHLHKTMECKWEDGTIPPPGAMTLTVTASPAQIEYNQTATVSWLATNVNHCHVGNDMTTVYGIDDSFVTPVLQETKDYFITCHKSSGPEFISGATSVIVHPTFSLEKTVNEFKNLVKKADLTEKGTVHMTATVRNLYNPTDYCKVLVSSDGVNYSTKLPEIKYFNNPQISVYDVDISGLTNDVNYYKLKCYNTAGNALPWNSSVINFNTQSIEISTPGNTNSCTILLGGSSCTIPTTWDTINPRSGDVTSISGATYPNGIPPSNSGTVSLIFSGINRIADGATSGTVDIGFMNSVDGPNGTSGTITAVDNLLAEGPITMNCATNTKWKASISACNNEPISVNAGPDKIITTNSIALTAGTSATDADGPWPVTSSWTNPEFPAGATVAITNGNTLTPTFNGLSIAGSYKFKLTATNSLQTSFDEMIVTKNNEDSWVVTAGAGIGGSVTPTGRSVLNGTSTTFQVTANQGYTRSTVNSSCNVLPEPWTGDTYTTDGIDKNCSILFSFTPNNYTVTFDKNNTDQGSTNASPSSASVPYGQSFNTLPTPPTRTGYVFSGWNTSMDGTGDTFTGATIIISNITLYAQWNSPDLIVSIPPPSLGTIVGTPVTYTATIKNQGTASTGASFYNLFQTATGFDNAENPINLIDHLVSPKMLTLNYVNGVNTADIQKSITFDSAGTRYVRVCTDKSSASNAGLINEGVNEGNNCSSWSSITVSSTIPTVMTRPISTITQTTALGGGSIIKNGGSNVTVSGCVWGTSPNPTTDSLGITYNGGTTVGTTWDCNITGLSPSTLYHVRAYATNSEGTAYGSDKAFSTTASMSGTLAPTGSASCSIPLDQSNCNINLSWSIVNPIGIPTSITSNGMANIDVTDILTTPQSGTKQVNISHGKRIFYLYNNEVKLDLTEVEAVCGIGGWNGVTCSRHYVTPSEKNGSHGTITPSTIQTVNYGTKVDFTITPNTEYYASVEGTCPLGTWSGNQYTTGTITGGCTVIANYTNSVFTVTPSAGANGFISPNTPQTVAPNTTLTFTVTPSAGYTSSIGGTCSEGTWVGDKYTTGAITKDCTVEASFLGMTGTLTPGPNTSCTIANGESNCSIDLNWTTAYVTGTPTAITSPGLSDIIVSNTLTTPNSGTASNIVVPHNSFERNFFLYNNGQKLAETNVATNCMLGSVWNVTSGVCEVEVPAGQPDLQASKPFITAEKDLNNMTIYSNIENKGNASTEPIAKVGFRSFIKKLFNIKNVFAGLSEGGGGEVIGSTGFYNLFQTSTNASNPDSPKGVIDYPITPEMAHIVAGGSRTTQSPITEFKKDDWVRFCADKNSAGDMGVITESDEKNNCSDWVEVDKLSPLPPEGSIWGDDCIIPENKSSCLADVSWTSSYTSGTVTLVSDGKILKTGIAGEISESIPFSSRDFSLKDNEVVLVTKTIGANCVAGTTWTIDKCIKIIIVPPTYNIGLNASKGTIVKGGATVVRWDSVDGWASSCVASSTDNNWTGDKGTSGGSDPLHPLVTTTYTLTCVPTDGSADVIENVTVKVIEPNVKEN